MICLKSPHTSFKPKWLKWPNVAQPSTGASNPPGSCSFQGSERTMSKTCRNEGTKRPLLSERLEAAAQACISAVLACLSGLYRIECNALFRRPCSPACVEARALPKAAALSTT
ncbi:unnamed protein product [Symbiodinium natans]|uniref:Uncharacterized protein n=1 Tax=Symbiodinium natans TaxID=878477 RepID=A0A812QZ29_9DINO|nr:unnamed protein product [Symbiodinium natans]